MPRRALAMIGCGAMVIIVTAAFAGVGFDCGDDSGWREQLRIVNDEDATFEARIEAEQALLQMSDATILRAVFELLAEPVGDWTPGYGPVSSGIGPKSWERDPAWRQIVSARRRIFSHFAHHAEPQEERQRILAELFDEATTFYELQQLLDHTRMNWTDAVRTQLIDIYKNAHLEDHYRPFDGWEAHVMPHMPRPQDHLRHRAGQSLLSMHHSTPRAEFVRHREGMIATAWNERGTHFSRLMAGVGERSDPRVAVLYIDLYLHERSADRRQTPFAHLADRMDETFGNISGLYRDRRAEATPEERVIKEQRRALQQEARETGDDTKLRKFEAERAAQQQAELEVRIARIDAWIAANRERLEKEAAAYVPPEQHERLRP